MYEFKRGELESAGGGREVRSGMQATAIGLSQPACAGVKVAMNPKIR